MTRRILNGPGTLRLESARHGQGSSGGINPQNFKSATTIAIELQAVFDRRESIAEA